MPEQEQDFRVMALFLLLHSDGSQCRSKMQAQKQNTGMSRCG